MFEMSQRGALLFRIAELEVTLAALKAELAVLDEPVAMSDDPEAQARIDADRLALRVAVFEQAQRMMAGRRR